MKTLRCDMWVIWGPPGRSCDEGGRDTLRRHTGFETGGQGPHPGKQAPLLSFGPLLPSAGVLSHFIRARSSAKCHDSERLVVTLQTHGRDIIYIPGLCGDAAVTDPRRPVMGLDPSSVSSAHQHFPERPVKGARGPAAAVPPSRVAIGSGPADPGRGREGARTPPAARREERG